MTIATDVAKLATDTALLHQIVHGDSNTVVTVESGTVRSLSNVISGIEVVEETATASASSASSSAASALASANTATTAANSAASSASSATEQAVIASAAATTSESFASAAANSAEIAANSITPENFTAVLDVWFSTLPTEFPSAPGAWWNNGGTLSKS